jgi:hypothetical protein
MKRRRRPALPLIKLDATKMTPSFNGRRRTLKKRRQETRDFDFGESDPPRRLR